MLPKGSSFDALTQADVDRVLSHVNSYARPGLDNRRPVDVVFDAWTPVPGPRPPPRSPPSHGASVQGIVTGLTFSPRKMRPSMSTIAVAIASTSASIQTHGSETNFSTPRLR